MEAFCDCIPELIDFFVNLGRFTEYAALDLGEVIAGVRVIWGVGEISHSRGSKIATLAHIFFWTVRHIDKVEVTIATHATNDRSGFGCMGDFAIAEKEIITASFTAWAAISHQSILLLVSISILLKAAVFRIDDRV